MIIAWDKYSGPRGWLKRRHCRKHGHQWVYYVKVMGRHIRVTKHLYEDSLPTLDKFKQCLHCGEGWGKVYW